MAYKKRSGKPDSVIGGLLSGFADVAEKSMDNNYKMGQIKTRGGLQEQLAQNNYSRKLDYNELQRQNKMNEMIKKDEIDDENREEKNKFTRERDEYRVKNRPVKGGRTSSFSAPPKRG